MSVGSIGALVTNLLGTASTASTASSTATSASSTASTASSNASTALSNAATALTNIGSAVDAFVNGLLGGGAGSGYTNTQAQNAATTTQQTAAAAAASAAAANQALAAQQAQSNANNAIGGVYYNIAQNGADGASLSSDFGSTGPTSGDLCIRGGTNEIGIKAANSDGVYWAVCAASRIFTTENQSITLTLGSQGGSTQAPQIGYLHCDSGFTAGTYAREDNGSVTLGSFTRSGSTFTYTPFSGGTWSGSLQSGNRVQIFNVGTTYSIVVGNQVMKTVTGSHTAGRFYWAISMDRKTTSSGWFFGSTTYDAFRVAAVSVSDYVQPTYPGSSARMTRTATATVAASSSAAGTLLPANFFGAQDASNSADYTVDPTNGKFTVKNAGRYMCIIRYKTGTNLGGATARLCPVLFYQGSVNQWGSDVADWANVTPSTVTPRGVQGTFILPMAANETVQAGYSASAAISAAFSGEITGFQCYFSIAKIG